MRWGSELQRSRRHLAGHVSPKGEKVVPHLTGARALVRFNGPVSDSLPGAQSRMILAVRTSRADRMRGFPRVPLSSNREASRSLLPGYGLPLLVREVLPRAFRTRPCIVVFHPSRCCNREEPLLDFRRSNSRCPPFVAATPTRAGQRSHPLNRSMPARSLFPLPRKLAPCPLVAITVSEGHTLNHPACFQPFAKCLEGTKARGNPRWLKGRGTPKAECDVLNLGG